MLLSILEVLVRDDQMILDLVTWATQWDAVYQPSGEVGFGRPCTGIMIGQSYIDYDCGDPGQCPDFEQTPDSYHKHDCLAVLIHDIQPIRPIIQLWNWQQKLQRGGYVLKEAGREVLNKFDFLLSGPTRPVLCLPDDKLCLRCGKAVKKDGLIWVEKYGQYRPEQCGYMIDDRLHKVD